MNTHTHHLSAEFQAQALAKLSVLIVEDEPVQREMMKELLQVMGVPQVLEAVDGNDALRVLGNSQVDLVLTDVNMAGMNGIELVTRIRADKKYTHLPVIVQSGRSETYGDIALQRGADRFFSKPAEIDDLIDAIVELTYHEDVQEQPEPDGIDFKAAGRHLN